MVRRYLSEDYECFICESKERLTSHHIRNHGKELCVFICWYHHQILHACGISKMDGIEYRYSTDEILRVLWCATRFKLFKIGEVKYVKRRLKEELNRRGVEMVKKKTKKIRPC